MVLGGVTLGYYQFRGFGVHHSEAGFDAVVTVLNHAVLIEYVPFIVLLFSLYVISGGIVIRGDIQATPLNNTIILAIGGGIASFVGTTGASMLLIRLLLKTNSERRHVVHTVVFFIFIVSNIGGTLLPIGDPPLFLGYLRGVPFLWTFALWKQWAFMLVAVLIVYYFWDLRAYKSEGAKQLAADRTQIDPVHMAGTLNFVWLALVVFAVATLDSAKAFPGTQWKPPMFLREAVQLGAVLAAWFTTSAALRKENQFNFVAIGEVACLFIGIFITMQTPLEILHSISASLAEGGFTQPWKYFWATGILSSFLDNAPTYVVFFETAAFSTDPAAGALAADTMPLPGNTGIPMKLLAAISCAAVFMGANSYIGNGPNFMVKSIAEQSGVKMPSFFGYMVYSGMILIPLFIVLTLVFFSPWS